MNLLNIISEIENVDPEFTDRIDTRRKAMSQFVSTGKKVALAALPMAIGSMFKKAYGQTKPAPLDILQFALKLEYLESYFYNEGAKAIGLIPASYVGFASVQADENAHVKFLQTVITAAGGTPVAMPAFDLTAKGTFPTVLSDFATYIAVAQAFEDTGVRAYKGQAANIPRKLIVGGANVLTAALGIHAVEARHASYIRTVRAATGVANLKPWITGVVSGINSPAVTGSYAGEDNISQANIKITDLPGVNGNISVNAATESFDEALTMEATLQIVAPFFK